MEGDDRRLQEDGGEELRRRVDHLPRRMEEGADDAGDGKRLRLRVEHGREEPQRVLDEGSRLPRDRQEARGEQRREVEAAEGGPEEVHFTGDVKAMAALIDGL